MTEIFNSLDTRELATAIWLSVFMFCGLTVPGVRKSLAALISAATARPIMIAFSLTIAYLAITSIALHSVGLWSLKQVKIAFLWFFVAGIPALMDTPEISRNPKLLKTSAVKNFKLALFLDIFINLYKLSFIAELIFVPFTALIGGMLAVAQSDGKYAQVHKLLNFILVTIGLSFLAFQFYKISTSFDSIANINTVLDLSLPIFYNIAFVPLLWAISVYAAYDSVFSRLKYVIRDETLHSYARNQLIIRFRHDVVSLNSWFKDAWAISINSRNDITRSIERIVCTREAA